MTLESLLISRDPALLGVLRPTLEKMSVSVEVCPESLPGSDILAKRKFDAVIVDCDDLKGGLAIAMGERACRSTQSRSF